MRIYLPVTATAVRTLLAGDELPAGPAGLTAFAVTPGLRRWYGEDAPAGAEPPDEEDLEYAACAEAARACLRLLAGEPSAPRRRVVLAVDAPDGAVTVRDDLDRGVVRVAAAVGVSALAALFVDDADAAPTVARAAEAIDAADLGDADAEETVGDAEGFELSWYGPEELATVDGELSGSASADG